MKSLVIAATASLVIFSSRAADLVANNNLGLRVQRGFTVELVADSDTAPDTYCMTFDARGRLVVANGQSIRTLVDNDDDGVADEAIVFANLARGAMGMCFDGPTLYVLGDQALLRFQDINGDGVADGPPEKILTFNFGEHCAHAIRRGPDGYWYIIAGNDTGFNAQNITSPDSPITKVEGGALVRLSPDLRTSECIAQGFRNPYDFDFGPLGDIFTYDSDTERDVFLPWYLPTRLYHVGFAQHHGWRLPGYTRSWPRPEYYADTAETMSRVGRGSPTGVTVYRHAEFPPAYRDGLFFCDWTFGRVYFAPLTIDGASYTTAPEVILEPIGMQGFAPSDIAVSPDGALYVSIGGRKTRGAVYRIAYAGLPVPSRIVPLANLDLNAVLLAPQPLDAWSRASWYPIAQRLGSGLFAQMAVDDTAEPELRIRAIEVLTEVFGGLPTLRVPALSQAVAPAVRARVAWSLGRAPEINTYNALLNLALDNSLLVRRSALDALIEQPMLLDPPDYARVVTVNLASNDKRVRLAAAKVASLAPDDSWEEVFATTRRSAPIVQAGGILASMWREPQSTVFPQFAGVLTNVLAQARDATTRAEAVRLIILAMGDWHLNAPSVEVFTGFEPAVPIAPEFSVVLPRVRALFPSGAPELDYEVARLLAMFQDDDPRSARALSAFLTESSGASQDFQYLVCLARLRAPLTEYAPRIARAILLLDRKLSGQGARVKQSWDTRLSELVQQFIRREPAIADAMLRDPYFPLPANVELANVFTGERRVTAARKFLAAVRGTRNFPWTSHLVDLLSELPRDEVFPLFRAMVVNPGVRDAIVLKLAAAPAAVDRPTFLGSLGSIQPQVVRASLDALLKLPPDPGGTNLVMPLRLLRRVVNEPQESLLRAQAVALISTSLKQTFNINDPGGADLDVLRATYQPIFNWVNTKYPALLRIVNSDEAEDPVRWTAFLKTVSWDKGDAARGQRLFTERGCAACHTGGGSIGPDLSGSVLRMSRDDLIAAVVFPSRDIAPAFRSTNFRLRDGQVASGIVAFESADGWLLQTGAGLSLRINSSDVVSREVSNVSLMPAGLLSGLSAGGVADLYAYLKSIQPRTAR